MDRSGKNGGHICTAGTDTRETGGAAVLKGAGEALRDNDDHDDAMLVMMMKLSLHHPYYLYYHLYSYTSLIR